MKLIVGLGNPGKKYENTLHNIGFMMVDLLQKNWSFCDWKLDGKFNAEVSEGNLAGEKVLLAKPQTYMNLSGTSVQKICNFYKLGPGDISVIYDDISMDFGKIRQRESGSAGGHNGVKDIIRLFGNYWHRIKIGVGKDEKIETSDWVLSKFKEEQLIDIVNEIFSQVEEKLQNFVQGIKQDSEVGTAGKSQSRGKKKTKKVYFVGIGGIGVSALARYYLSEGYEVSGSDSVHSELIEKLQNEGCDIIIGNDAERINSSFKKVIYSEAVPLTQIELVKATELGITCLRYNNALGEVVNRYKLIAVTGTHGKSTTSSMVSLLLQSSGEPYASIVGTLLKEFDGKNFSSSLKPGNTNGFFAIEACEYKEHFLAYKPLVGIITNIEYDHADYFKTPESYIEAYEKFIDNIQSGGYCILCSEDLNCNTLIDLRDDITYIGVTQESFRIYHPDGITEVFDYPQMNLQVPGAHILMDAKLTFALGHMLGMGEDKIINTLQKYNGVWRRMEILGETAHGNTLISDYGHHPTEISLTLSAIKEKYPTKHIYTIFQPHQYNRTLELLGDFKNCFNATDTLIIPDIYESRDSDEDKAKINSKKLAELIDHPNVHDGKGMKNTLKLLEKFDSENNRKDIIVLLGAGNVDNLRYKIKMR